MSKTASRKLSNLMDREVMDAFNLFDRNKDGKITSEEIKELITSLGGDAQCPHVQVSAFEDEEGDELYSSNPIFCISKELVKSAESQASVDVRRFMYLWKDFKAKVEDEDEDEEEIKSAFRAYDINGDGYITKDEMVQVRHNDGLKGCVIPRGEFTQPKAHFFYHPRIYWKDLSKHPCIYCCPNTNGARSRISPPSASIQTFSPLDAFRAENDRSTSNESVALHMTDGVTLSAPIKLPVCRPLWQCSCGHEGKGGRERHCSSKRARFFLHS